LAGMDASSGPKGLYVQGLHIEVSFHLGVLRQQDLEAPVKAKVLDYISLEPPADAVGSFEQQRAVARPF